MRAQTMAECSGDVQGIRLRKREIVGTRRSRLEANRMMQGQIL